ncbi:hypothetical protein HDU96_007960 [Phlyctochytrium bullatum]|nr:hypothetical protein HDU96_007960 [Phlyctochytrium bullatum]
METLPSTWYDELDAVAKKESHALLHRFAAHVMDAGVPCRAISLRGEAREEIVRKATELKARGEKGGEDDVDAVFGEACRGCLEELWEFMCFVNNEVAFIQSQIDKKLDRLESVKEAREKIEEKLQTLQEFPSDQEQWDAWVKSLNKLHEEVGKLKVEEGYKD